MSKPDPASVTPVHALGRVTMQSRNRIRNFTPTETPVKRGFFSSYYPNDNCVNLLFPRYSVFHVLQQQSLDALNFFYTDWKISDSKLFLSYHPPLQKEELCLQNLFGPHSVLETHAFEWKDKTEFGITSWTQSWTYFNMIEVVGTCRRRHFLSHQEFSFQHEHQQPLQTSCLRSIW